VAPKAKKTINSPFDEHPFVPGSDILLISNYKQPTKGYFPHASGKELENYLLASMQYSVEASQDTNITLFAPMPGRLYFLNRTLIAGRDPGVNLSKSLEKLQPQQNSSSESIELINLDNECDVDAYDEIIRWITAQSPHILAAADTFLKENPDCQVKIYVPQLDKSKNSIKLTSVDLFATNRNADQTTPSKKRIITLNFLHQWPDIYSPEDKINELAHLIAHFKKGQEVYNKNPAQIIVALTQISNELSKHHLDLSKLPNFEEKDLKVLCDLYKISYEDYQDNNGSTCKGLKNAIAAAEINTINEEFAKRVFVDTCILAFKSFTTSRNGPIATSTTFNDKNTSLVPSAFWGNILFMIAELPLLILASEEFEDIHPKIEYNQPPHTDSLTLISAVATTLGKGSVNFHQPKIAIKSVQNKRDSGEFSNGELSPTGSSPPQKSFLDQDNANGNRSDESDSSSVDSLNESADDLASELIKTSHKLLVESFKSENVSVFIVLQHVRMFLKWYEVALLHMIYHKPVTTTQEKLEESKDIIDLKTKFSTTIVEVINAIEPLLKDKPNEFITAFRGIAPYLNGPAAGCLGRLTNLLEKPSVQAYEFHESKNTQNTVQWANLAKNTVDKFQTLDESIDEIDHNDAATAQSKHRENTLLLFTALTKGTTELKEKTNKAVAKSKFK
jgi:hypothetical protein